MDTTFAQWILGQMGVGGIAALSLYLLNKSHNDAMQREKYYADTLRSDRSELIRVLTETTSALTSLEDAIDHLANERSKQ